MENFVIFRFETSEFIVKYTCSKDNVSKEDIEDCAVSYYGSDAYNEEVFYKDIIHDIMSSFDGVEYEIINAFDKYIDME
jgi:hypothetical protein